MAGTGMRLGRIFGIELRLAPSWFIAFVLISWLLAATQLPGTHPGWAPVAYWGIALSASALLFVSVVAHELGHAFVAKYFGIPVRDVTLFIFGGVARLGREPRRARDELLIALAGPAASLLLALGFAGLRRAGGGMPEPYLALFGWLAAANAILAGFNLLPGFPMDGGRVVRALLWGATGNLRRATQIAANGGRVVAYLFIAWGLLQIFAGNLVGGIWLVLIGMFLHTSATQAHRQAPLTNVPSGMTVRDVISQSPSVHPWTTLDTVMQQALVPSGQHCVPVIEGREWRGLLSLAAIQRIPRHAWPNLRAMHVMQESAKALTVSPYDPLAPVVERMANEGISFGAVIEHDQIVGLLDLDFILTILRLREEMGGTEADSGDRVGRTMSHTGAKIA